MTGWQYYAIFAIGLGVAGSYFDEPGSGWCVLSGVVILAGEEICKAIYPWWGR